ncbi:unnamed protein product [Arabidopsis lyrata]|uniref:Serine protease inhibitor, potato inhibitor I-type family protein n=1 Tax=Arabidopsis lyrata subsp. lyrata TaxID=81972 RepID=D7LT19_ARALL|nr:inhibitor of trypsin and hageman factor [Arabidopsis lyrata subsp. lyrata]EFH53981.1 serine protease inhibitor, potato inhibitor I-type family protein [Arabidopsis lyrata subsp. lyrata]CAH8268095.1 unnamed protein product [Arabidopsis lyrata]|eukprot:XP_002877722.1 inhibitor of trypsin and hageman factor [Arabidopsis lyrata subsp. lyrata]
MNRSCPIFGPPCQRCSCAGISCQPLFPGMKVEWPELTGVSGLEAKRRIEHDNPKVVAVIIPDDVAVVAINCCNRVILRVPVNNCPNGPVLNIPHVG